MLRRAWTPGCKLSVLPGLRSSHGCDGSRCAAQGFPEDFVLEWEGQRNPNRLYHQLGNAVSPATVALIGRAVQQTGALG